MKRHYLTVAVLAFALGMTACSPGNKETITTPTTTAVQTEMGKFAGAEDNMELKYFYDSVEEVADKVVAVKNDVGREVKFDVFEAEIEDANAAREGDEVGVACVGKLSSDMTKVKSVGIITSAAAEVAEEAAAEGDAIATGTIKRADDNILTLTMDKGIYTSSTKIVQKISKDGVKSGIQVDVTYYGDLEDNTDKPVATKTVTEGAMDSEDVKINTLSDKVAEVGVDYVIVDIVDPENTPFTFLGEEGMFDKLRTGDIAIIIYKGTSTDKTVTATGAK